MAITPGAEKKRRSGKEGAVTFSHLIPEGFLRSNARVGRRAQLKNGTAKDKSANLPIFDTGKYGKRILGRHFAAAYRIEERGFFFGNAKISKQDTNDTLFYGYVGTGTLAPAACPENAALNY